MTVLIVDDHPSFRASARTLLEAEGYEIVVLTSSRDSADYGSCIQICGASGFVPKADLSGAAIAALLIA